MTTDLASPLTAEELAETPDAVELNGAWYDPDHLHHCEFCKAAFAYKGDLGITSDGLRVCAACESDEAPGHESWVANGRKHPNHWRS